MALYITWKEQDYDFVRFEYIGSGVTVPIMKAKTVTKKARWSTEETPEMKSKAREYIRTEMRNREYSNTIKLISIPDEL